MEKGYPFSKEPKFHEEKEKPIDPRPMLDQPTSRGMLLPGVKGMASYLVKSEKTVKKYMREGMPYDKKNRESQQSRVFGWSLEIDNWLKNQNKK